MRVSHALMAVAVWVWCGASAPADVLLQADLEGIRYTVEGPAPQTVPAGEPFAITVRAEPAGFAGARPLQIAGESAIATLVVPDDAVLVIKVPDIIAYYPELRLPQGFQAMEGWQPLKVRSELANKSWKLVERTARQLVGMVPGVGPVVGISKFLGDMVSIANDKPVDWFTLAKLENTFDMYDYEIPPWSGTISALEVKWWVQFEPRVTDAVPVTLLLGLSTQRTPLYLRTPHGARLAVELPAPQAVGP